MIFTPTRGRAGRRTRSAMGSLEFRSSSGSLPGFVVEVIEVLFKKASEITTAELRENGFTDYEHMLSGMKRFYPDFGPASDITLIRWA
jgi:hypothetical protein